MEVRRNNMRFKKLNSEGFEETSEIVMLTLRDAHERIEESRPTTDRIAQKNRERKDLSVWRGKREYPLPFDDIKIKSTLENILSTAKRTSENSGYRRRDR